MKSLFKCCVLFLFLVALSLSLFACSEAETVLLPTIQETEASPDPAPQEESAIRENDDTPAKETEEIADINIETEIAAPDDSLAAARTDAITEINQYAITNAPDVSADVGRAIIAVIENYTDLIGKDASEGEIERDTAICRLYIDLQILEDWKANQDEAISEACDENITFYYLSAQELSQYSVYSETQYNADLSYWERKGVQAQSDYVTEVQRAHSKASELGLSGSGYEQSLINEAARKRDAALKEVKEGKELAEAKLSLLREYERTVSLYEYWCGYKYGLSISIESQYNERKGAIEQALETYEKKK